MSVSHGEDAVGLSVPFWPSLRRGDRAAALHGNLMDRGTSRACCGTSAELSLPRGAICKRNSKGSLMGLPAGSSKLRFISCRRCKLGDCANSGLMLWLRAKSPSIAPSEFTFVVCFHLKFSSSLPDLPRSRAGSQVCPFCLKAEQLTRALRTKSGSLCSWRLVLTSLPV